MPFTSLADLTLFDAGMFIGALLKGDPRHAEARPLVEAARRGEMRVCTTPSILSEVYGALTWEKAQPRHDPEEAAEAVALLVEAPSAIRVLDVGLDVALRLCVRSLETPHIFPSVLVRRNLREWFGCWRILERLGLRFSTAT